MSETWNCLQRLMNGNKCFGRLIALPEWDELADFKCPRCGAYYTTEYLIEEKELREENTD